MVEHLLKNAKLIVPQSLVKRQLHYRLNEAIKRLKAQGLNDEELKKKEEELLTQLQPAVEREVKIYLILEEIAKLEKQLMKIDAENLRLQKEQVELAFDHEKLSAVMKELADVEDRKSEIEEQWLSATSNLEGLTN